MNMLEGCSYFMLDGAKNFRTVYQKHKPVKAQIVSSKFEVVPFWRHRTGGGGLKCDLAWHLFLLDDFIEFGLRVSRPSKTKTLLKLFRTIDFKEITKRPYLSLLFQLLVTVSPSPMPRPLSFSTALRP
jgi:hypothetical protein